MNWFQRPTPVRCSLPLPLPLALESVRSGQTRSRRSEELRTDDDDDDDDHPRDIVSSLHHDRPIRLLWDEA